LDYFPFDVLDSDELKLFEAEFGLKGYAVYVKLLQRVYSVHGYYTQISDDVLLMFAKREVGLSVRSVSEIINGLIRRRIFDGRLYAKYNILTSEDIQKNYLSAKRQTPKKILEAYRLIKVPENEVFVTETEVIATKTQVNVTETPQRLKKNIVSLSIAPTINEVKAYAAERSSAVSPERFHCYYSALGWVVNGEAVKDWKALFRSWEPNERAKRQTPQATAQTTTTTTTNTRKGTKFVNYNQPVYTKEQINEVIKNKRRKKQ
jgi:hypothetical protein